MMSIEKVEKAEKTLKDIEATKKQIISGRNKLDKLLKSLSDDCRVTMSIFSDKVVKSAKANIQKAKEDQAARNLKPEDIL